LWRFIHVTSSQIFLVSRFFQIRANQARSRDDHFRKFHCFEQSPPCKSRARRRKSPHRAIHQPQKISPMAATPSKDYKRREREQRKLDKRMARESAKDQELAAKQAAEEAIQARLEAEFEAELAAEREGHLVA
jgi:hypothetical protein